MPIQILMPALSPTMEKGNLAKWHVKEGDEVKSGDVIAEIETDKATMEFEAVDEGKIGKILISEGSQDVAVNEPIAVLLEEGEDEAALAEAEKPAKPQAKAEKPAEDKAAQKEAEPGSKSEAKPAEAPNAEAAPAKQKGPARDEGGKAPPAPKTEGGERVFASPLARRLAEQNGLDLTALKGSGPRGRVVQADIEAALASGEGKKAAAKPAAGAPAEAGKPAAAASMSDQQIRAFFEDGSFEEHPNDGMRKTIARRLLESKQTIPHFYLTLDCQIDALLSLRKQINEAAPAEGPGAYKLSVNDFIVKAMAMALRKVPAANATWTEAATLRHKHSDVGVAVAIEGGLFTPVVRKAEGKTLSAISAEMKDFAKRARDRKLKPEEYQGGTTSISNLGMYGIREFSAVINPPHGTILAVGAGEKRAVVRDGEVKAATCMTVTLSCDHRVVDGALGAELLSAFKGYVENPMSMLV